MNVLGKYICINVYGYVHCIGKYINEGMSDYI